MSNTWEISAKVFAIDRSPGRQNRERKSRWLRWRCRSFANNIRRQQFEVRLATCLCRCTHCLDRSRDSNCRLCVVSNECAASIEHQKRKGWKWRWRNSDTVGQPKERQAAHAAAEVSKSDHWLGRLEWKARLERCTGHARSAALRTSQVGPRCADRETKPQVHKRCSWDEMLMHS